MSVFVWSMIGIAVWHFTIFLPDRFVGGIMGAFFAAWFGAVLSGFALAGFTIPEHNPPGMSHVIWSLPGSLLGLACAWAEGARRESRARRAQPAAAAAPAR